MLKRVVVAFVLLTPAVVAEDAPLPRPRPVVNATEPAPPAVVVPIETPEANAVVPTPRDYQVACPAVMSGKAKASSLPPIHDGQCGVQSPLALSAVSANGRDIPLSSTIATDCGMATAFPDWVADIDRYLIAHDSTRLARVDVSTSYECRNVNHAATGTLSFHAFADAVDIMGFGLEDGRTISISPGWNGTPEQGRTILRFARDAACTHFATVLSPDADSAHQDNLHLDLACHGKSCTTRLCQ